MRGQIPRRHRASIDLGCDNTTRVAERKHHSHGRGLFVVVAKGVAGPDDRACDTGRDRSYGQEDCKVECTLQRECQRGPKRAACCFQRTECLSGIVKKRMYPMHATAVQNIIKMPRFCNRSDR